MQTPFLPVQQARAVSWSQQVGTPRHLCLRNGTRCIRWPPAQAAFYWAGFTHVSGVSQHPEKGALFFRPWDAPGWDGGVLLRQLNLYQMKGVAKALEAAGENFNHQPVWLRKRLPVHVIRSSKTKFC